MTGDRDRDAWLRDRLDFLASEPAVEGSPIEELVHRAVRHGDERWRWRIRIKTLSVALMVAVLFAAAAAVIMVRSQNDAGDALAETALGGEW
ncbi:MAG: hypothetical protein AAGF12_39065 [Myxococcota bacterium]